MRIELTEVEHHLSSLEGVKQAVAVVHMDSIQQQHLVAYLSPKNIDIDKVREHVAKFLPKQMIPECFVLLEQLPKMPNGKADRTSLPEPQYSDMAMANYTAPSNETQEVVGFLIVLRMVHAGLADANILMQPEWCCTATVSLVACGMQGTA